MENININETKLYKKNVQIHKNLLKVYASALVIGITIITIKGLA